MLFSGGTSQFFAKLRGHMTAEALALYESQAATELGAAVARRFGCTSQSKTFLETFREGGENRIFFSALIGACAVGASEPTPSADYYLWQLYYAQIQNRQDPSTAHQMQVITARKNVDNAYPRVMERYENALIKIRQRVTTSSVQPWNDFISAAGVFLQYSQTLDSGMWNIERIQQNARLARSLLIPSSSHSFGIDEALAHVGQPADPTSCPHIRRLHTRLLALHVRRISQADMGISAA